jgi:hypothetical protein
MNKPVKPSKPKPPLQTRVDKDESKLELWDGSKLSELLETALPLEGTNVVHHDQISFERGDEYTMIVIPYTQTFTYSDYDFKLIQKKHKKQLEVYEKKLAKYESDMVKYAAFLAKQAIAKEQEELKLLAELKKKYPNK